MKSDWKTWAIAALLVISAGLSIDKIRMQSKTQETIGALLEINHRRADEIEAAAEKHANKLKLRIAELELEISKMRAAAVANQ